MHFVYEERSSLVNTGNRLDFAPHLHGRIELVYMRQGRSLVQVDSKEYEFGAGEALIVFPNQVHSYRTVDLEDYVICIFSPDDFPEYSAIFRSLVPVSPVIDCGEKVDVIRQLMEKIERLEHTRPAYWEGMQRGYYLVLLGELFGVTDFCDAGETNSDDLQKILHYCATNYTEELCLEDLARAVHLSKYTVSRIFSQKLHMSFCDYLGSLRISQACRRLETKEESITSIAYAVGAGSTRSFNRLFQKHTGMTPRQYRATRGGKDA